MICACCGAEMRIDADTVASNLPPVQAAVVRALSRDFGRYVKTGELAARVWWRDPQGGPAYDKVCISQAIARARPLISSHGLRIEAKQWAGYRLVAA